MKRLIFIVAFALAGCASEAKKAEEEYRMIQETPLAEGQLCAAATKVRDAYLAEGDDESYKLWTLFAQVDCTKARRY